MFDFDEIDTIDCLGHLRPQTAEAIPNPPSRSPYQVHGCYIYDGTKLEFELESTMMEFVTIGDSRINIDFVYEDGLFSFLKELKLRMQDYWKKMDFVFVDSQGNHLMVECEAMFTGNFEFNITGFNQLVSVSFAVKNVEVYHTSDEKKEYLSEA